jgi:hypothetical protein
LNTKWNETQFATESRLKKSLIVSKKFILPWNFFYESKITYKFCFAERFICFVRDLALI